MEKERKLILKDVIQRHRFFFGDLASFHRTLVKISELMERSDFFSFYLSETFYLEKSPGYIITVQKR